MNGVEDDCPASCLSILSFARIPLALSTANLTSSRGKSAQYNLVGSAFMKTSHT